MNVVYGPPFGLQTVHFTVYRATTCCDLLESVQNLAMQLLRSLCHVLYKEKLQWHKFVSLKCRSLQSDLVGAYKKFVLEPFNLPTFTHPDPGREVLQVTDVLQPAFNLVASVIPAQQSSSGSLTSKQANKSYIS